MPILGFLTFCLDSFCLLGASPVLSVRWQIMNGHACHLNGLDVLVSLGRFRH